MRIKTETIKDYIRSENISIHRLEIEADLSNDAVRNLMAGKTMEPRISLIYKIAKILGIKMEEMIEE